MGVKRDIDLGSELVVGSELQHGRHIWISKLGGAVVNQDAARRAVGIEVLRRGRQVVARSGHAHGVVKRRPIGVGQAQLAVGDDGVAGVGAGAGQDQTTIAPLFQAVAAARIADHTTDRATLTDPIAQTGIASQQDITRQTAADQAQRAQSARALVPAQAFEVKVVGHRACTDFDVRAALVLHLHRARAKHIGGIDAGARIGLHHHQAGEVGAGPVDVIGVLVLHTTAHQAQGACPADAVVQIAGPPAAVVVTQVLQGAAAVDLHIARQRA